MASPIQTDFSAGEITPKLGGRFDSAIFKKALRYCRNFEPTPWGSLLLAAGSRHVKKLAGDNRTRVIRFRMVDGQDYLVELANRVMRLYSVDGAQLRIQFPNNMEMVENGDFSYSGAGWQTFTFKGCLVDFAGGTANLSSFAADNPAEAAGILQQFMIPYDQATAHFSWTATYDGADGQIEVRVGTDPLGFDLYHYTGTDANGSKDLGPLPLNTTIYISIFAPKPATLTHLNSIHVDNISFLTTSAGNVEELRTPWTVDQLAALTFATETGLDRTIFAHGNVAPYYLKYRGPNAWDFRQIAFQNQPAEWGGAVWPGIIEFHKGRAYYSGVSTFKNRLWGSVANDPFNISMATGAPPAGSTDPYTQLPGDALDLKIATSGTIRGLRGSTSLLICTDLGESSLTGSKGVPLNGDYDVRRESAFGSAAWPPVDAGSLALYISADRKKVRAIDYNLQSNKWESKDVSFITGILATDPLKEIHHAFAPEGVIVGVRDSGKLAMCGFSPSEQVVGWWRRELASGQVRSAAVSQGPLGAFLWMVVERDGAVYLERLPLAESTDDLTYLDASVRATVNAVGAVVDLDHLEGKNARVVDGTTVLGDFLVAGGVIQLDAALAGKSVVIGLPYSAKATTLPKLSKDGRVRQAKVGVILNDSALPILNGRRYAERTPGTVMDMGEPRVTGKRKTANRLGWDDEGCIDIEQDLPLRTEILGLYEATVIGEVDA